MTILAGIDIETTGLNQANGHRITEIAIGLYRWGGGSLNKIGMFQRRINPERSIDAKAEEVTGLTLADLLGEPKWDDIAPIASKILSKAEVVVAHNGAAFDVPFLEGEFRRLRLDGFPQFRLIDTMTQARWATYDGSLPSLQALASACDVDYDKARAHAAEYDVDVMMKCVS